MQSAPTEETSALLARLTSRPNVRSTLILSREDGAIVRSTGLLSAEDEPEHLPTANGDDGEGLKKGIRNAEELAKVVWNYTKSCAELVENMNGHGDEVKLCRLRTKKNELVIVPDAKFLLVVVHDTPPA